MAGQWQREFFLITEDPFAVDLCVFDLWLAGHTVREAAEIRWRNFDAAQPELYQQFGDLLRQDCAQQYEAFEFLESALADPVHFLEFCPVQLAPGARHEFVRRYYSLDSQVVREVLRQPNALQIRLQGGGDKKAMASVEHIAKSSGEKVLKVKRIFENLQRACRWVENAASQRSSGPVTSSVARSAVSPTSSCVDMADTHGDEGSFVSTVEGAGITTIGGAMGTDATATQATQACAVLPLVPELEALGEPLLWRYRSLTFVMLCRFDFCSKAAMSLQIEHVEDIAAVLLASGGILTAALKDSPELRSRVVEVLSYLEQMPTQSLVPFGGGTSTPALAGPQSPVTQGSPLASPTVGPSPATNVPPASVCTSPSARPAGVAQSDWSLRDGLRQLDSKVLRPRFHEFKGILLQELDRPNDPTPAGVSPEDRSISQPTGSPAWGRGFFARRVIAVGVRMERTKLDPAILALLAGMASLQMMSSFQNFFSCLADFIEKCRQLDSSDPLELFQRCYTAAELLCEKEQMNSKKISADWLSAWRTFLEFYRACSACVLIPTSNSPTNSPNPAWKSEAGRTPTFGGAVGNCGGSVVSNLSIIGRKPSSNVLSSVGENAPAQQQRLASSGPLVDGGPTPKERPILATATRGDPGGRAETAPSRVRSTPWRLGDGGAGRLPWRRSAIRCLHALTCHACDPPPELSVGAELAALTTIFGLASVPAAIAAECPQLSLSYCVLGLARQISGRWRQRHVSLPARTLIVIGTGTAAGLWLWYKQEELLARHLLWLAVAASELCWPATYEKVQDECFDFFSTVLFVFCGIMFTFGLYPLTLSVASLAMKQYDERHHTTPAPHWAVPSGGQQVAGGGGGFAASLGDGTTLNGGFELAAAHLVPLVVLFVGVPALAACVLVYCWLCEHMMRMLQAVVASVVGWLGLYGLLVLFKLQASEALLATCCVLMYDACGRMLHVEWGCFNVSVRRVALVFACYFTLDQVAPSEGGARCRLLLSFVLVVKLTCSTVANKLKAPVAFSSRRSDLVHASTRSLQ